VGTSGSGKSTILSLIMAFTRPTSGRILVDGHDMLTVRLRDYRSHLGVVLQDNFLFDGSIADNIAFGAPGATQAQVMEAARVARCDEFVRAFPDGFDTLVGERGVKLSGGQRQRVAIARAILADPQILLLDEATSSLDSESEQQIKEGLAALRKGRTTFVIAHRLSTISSADQILVVEEAEGQGFTGYKEYTPEGKPTQRETINGAIAPNGDILITDEDGHIEGTLSNGMLSGQYAEIGDDAAAVNVELTKK
jgi:subfamily B ATP-binding cassette protein MsbA